jgi:hypothetical protein
VGLTLLKKVKLLGGSTTCLDSSETVVMGVQSSTLSIV